MNCPNCGRDIVPADRFCPWCGAPQHGPSGPIGVESNVEGNRDPAEVPAAFSTEDRELRQLRTDVDAVTTEVALISSRLSDLERQRGTRQPGQRPLMVPETAPSSGQHAASPAAGAPTRPGQRVSAQDVARAATTPAPSPPVQAGVAPGRAYASMAAGSASEPARPSSGGGIALPPIPRLPVPDFGSWNWEWLVGGNWLARIGVVALIFGVAFLISLAIDRGWLGEVERVALGVIGGLALMGAGEYWRRRYAVWAQTVTGGGLAILYLSVYGSFALYELISPPTAFAGFSVITLAGAFLSLRHESVAVAVFSIFGGFATPLLLYPNLPDERLLLVYVLVLDVGVLALAGFRNWRWFTMLAWIGSLFLFGFWNQELDPPTVLAQVGITAIFLIFAGATVAFHLVRKQASGPLDLALITLNAAAFYGISYFLIYDEYRPLMGGFTAALAAFYGLMAAACRMRGEAQLNLTLFSAGLAVVFAVLAVPVQLGGPWISIAWGIEALVLVWMSLPLRMRELRWAGYAMIAVSAVWLLAIDTPGAFAQDFTPFLNEYTLSFAAAVALPALAAWLLHRRREELESWEHLAVPVLALRSAVVASVFVPVQLDGIWIPIGWMVESVLLLRLSFALKMRELRGFGYIMAAVFSGWLLAVDSVAAFGDDLTPFLNWYMLGYAASVATLGLSAWLLWQRRDLLERNERQGHVVFALAACVFAAIAVPAQLDGAWVTVAWAVEAALLLWLSFPLRLREVRWFGYLLFAALSLWMLATDTPQALREDLVPFLNFYMLANTAVVVSAAVSAWLLWHRRDRLERYEQAAYPAFAVGAAVGAAVAFPTQLEWPWITVAWAGEVLVLLWLSFALRMHEIRWFGYALSVTFSAWLLGWDTPRALGEDFTFFLNWHMLNHAVAVLASAAAGYMLWRHRQLLHPRERHGITAFALAAGVFAAVAVPVQVSGVWITIGWAVASVILLALSRRLGVPELRWLGYGLMAAMLVRLFGLDTFDVDLQTFRPLVNWRFLAFGSAIAALYTAAVFELRGAVPEGPAAESRAGAAAVPVLLALANLATLWLLSAEIIATADSAWLNLAPDASENVASLGLSLLWGVYAAALIVLGVTRRWRWVRLAGLALLAVPVVKLFAFDSRLLEQEYRVIAFLALGVILVAGGLLYQRYSRVVRGFLFEQ